MGVRATEKSLGAPAKGYALPPSAVTPPKAPPPDDNVIHVDFGRGRGKGPGARGAGLAPPPVEATERDTVARTFTPAEVADLFGLTVRRLQGWEARGIIVPSARKHWPRIFTFTDLLAVRTAKGLADAGFSLARIERAVDSLRRRLPDLAQPLADARVGAEGDHLVARRDGTAFDPVTGQLELDFDVQAIREDVVRVLRPRVSRRMQDAYAHYLEGLRLDEDETTRGRAEEAYRKAMELDPGLATAITNLGNLRLLAGDRHEAARLYRQAMEADTTLAEAPYNLAYLLVEEGRQGDALALFERAIALRPDFAEAHFNLAMALSELGHRDRARGHWRRYLELEPRGPWATVARHNLDND